MPALAVLSAEIALVALVVVPAVVVFAVLALVAVALVAIAVGVAVGWTLTRASAAIFGEGAEIWR
jgi:hypothetical protein